MNLRSILLVAVITLFPFSEGHSQTPQKNCSPGISFWRLVDGVSIGYMDGRLSVGRLFAICLPTPAQPSTSNYPYDPDSGGKLKSLVKTADGKVLNTYVWYAESVGALWEMSRYKVLGGYEAVKPLTAGSYVLEFAIDDKPFYKFPFSVVAMKSEDPYQAAGTRYFIEGAWNDYGNIYYQRNDPASILTFTTWLRNKVGSQAQTSLPYDIKLISARDSRVLAEHSGTLRLEPRWLKAALNFQSAGERKGYFKAGDLLREDGRYSVRLTINNKLHGEYPFVVKGGRIELQGKQIREKTDPMSYIVDYLSGGRYTSWWIVRQAAQK